VDDFGDRVFVTTIFALIAWIWVPWYIALYAWCLTMLWPNKK
jgi:hypothetical protein